MQVGNNVEKLSKASSPRPWLTRLSTFFQTHLEMFKTAFKTSLGPIIVVCLIQSTTWANYFQANIYISAILAAIATPMAPRSVVIEFNFGLTLAVALMYSYGLFAGWCGVQARVVVDPKDPYDSSAAAVVAIFQTCGAFMVYSIKSAFPSLTLQCILAGVYMVATLPGLALAPTMEAVIAISDKVVETFLAGQAIGLAVALLIFPRNSRDMFILEVEKALTALSAVMRARPTCLDDLVLTAKHPTETENCVKSLKTSIAAFAASSSKIQTQLAAATKEWTVSHLGRTDLQKLSMHIMTINTPLVGLNSIADMLLVALKERLLLPEDGVEENASEGHRVFIGDTQQYANEVVSVIDDGIAHALTRLRSKPQGTSTAQLQCIDNTCKHMQDFEKTLESYRCWNGQVSEDSERRLLEMIEDDQAASVPYRAILSCFLSLHLLTLLSATGTEFFEMMLFLEESQHNKRTFHFPFRDTIRDWRTELVSSIRRATTRSISATAHLFVPVSEANDPDHLPATSMIERVGNGVRQLWSFFGSKHAAIGARGALAVMTVAILAFLKRTHEFYESERFLWALFAILLSLDRTAGASTLKLLFRFLGTVASMIASYILWYICDQKTAGIIVFLWVWLFIIGYVMCRYPQLAPAGFIAFIAAIVMNANELQVRKLGKDQIIADGQAIYPPYIIFPYRLAIVTSGIVVAYFWTLFPKPLPEHTELRKELADAVLNLAVLGTSLSQVMSNRLSASRTPQSDREVDKLVADRRETLRRHQMLISRIQATMKTITWEFSLGGKFPLEPYRRMVELVSRLGDLLTLTGYVSRALDGGKLANASDEDGHAARQHLAPQGLATRLVVLCSALTNAHPLPPGLSVLKIPDLRHFLDKRIATDECFAVASLVHSANYFIIRDINELTE